MDHTRRTRSTAIQVDSSAIEPERFDETFDPGDTRERTLRAGRELFAERVYGG